MHTLCRKKRDLEQRLNYLRQKQKNPTTGYPDYSRTDPFAEEIEHTKYEIAQIDLRIGRRRDIVVSLIIGSMIGSVITALVTKLIDKIF